MRNQSVVESNWTPASQHLNTNLANGQRWWHYINQWLVYLISMGWVQERRNSSALAMELHLSWTNPSTHVSTAICCQIHHFLERWTLHISRPFCSNFLTVFSRELCSVVSESKGRPRALYTETKMSSFWQNFNHCLCALEIVILTTSSAASDKNFIIIKTLSFRSLAFAASCVISCYFDNRSYLWETCIRYRSIHKIQPVHSSTLKCYDSEEGEV